MALLPHLTAAELGVLLGAVERWRRHAGHELRTLSSLSTAISEAIYSADLETRRLRQQGTCPVCGQPVDNPSPH